MHPSDPTLALGSAIFAFVEPHRGFEVAFNRWYERDHLPAAGSGAPFTFAMQRWVATPPLKALRYPAGSPICRPLVRGSYLSALWIEAGRLEEQQAWVAERMKELAEQGRGFEHRDIVTTARYDFLGAARRDPDGVPPELALDRRYPGLVACWLERTGETSLEALRDELLDERLPPCLEASPIALALLFTPLPNPSWWPAAAPEAAGLGARILVACFVDCDPRACWRERFAGLGAALEAGGRCRTLLVAPFVPVVPGTDLGPAELW